MNETTKATTAVTIQNVFNALLFGLPQGVLLGLVWIAYSAWTTLTMRRLMKT
jgi:hypothetical protein